ncbi:hypothetical protein M2277_005612 [Paenibacillus sp. LBL]|uniref:hypothetical protein n=1 Tax=Paenibacillus sp. LBL TaxID=2940563 RepID=UPI002473D88F|nr:hypothetical protein [Paenibacillus sp. LBL]MDH6674913.1 hypothetical protein [Paenibacillus sp. LBL]
MNENNDVFTKEEREEARRDEMRELLMNAFDGTSLLYEIYKKRGWLDKILTDKILSMDKDALYLSSQVADICETHDYVIKNKRRELLEYINPTQMGEGNSKIYKHNYISVFKLKMIHGLTGEGSEFTLPQLKEIIYGNITKSTTEQKQDAGNDMMFQMMKKMEQFDKFYDMVQSGEFFNEIDKRAQESARRLMLEGTKDDEVKEKVLEIYEKIISPDTDLTEKETFLALFNDLENEYPGQAYTIKMYKNASEDRINRFRQDEREMYIRKVKETISDLLDDYESAKSENERNLIRDKLQKIGRDNPDLSFEIRYWFSTIGKEKKKKGFFGRIFS